MATAIINLEAPTTERKLTVQDGYDLLAQGDEETRFYVDNMAAAKEALRNRDLARAEHCMRFANEAHARAKAHYRAARAIADAL